MADESVSTVSICDPPGKTRRCDVSDVVDITVTSSGFVNWDDVATEKNRLIEGGSVFADFFGLTKRLPGKSVFDLI